MSVDTTSLGANSIVRNTVTNRNVLAPVLYSICTNNNAAILLTEDNQEYELNSTDVYQALCVQNGQPVEATGYSGTALICVGPDTSLKALEWMNHLNLLEVGRLVTLQFYVSKHVLSGEVVLATTVGPTTHDHIEIQQNGTSAAATGYLFYPTACAGNRVLVEVSCVNNTSGSEKVVFNVLDGTNWNDCSEIIS